MFPQCVGQVGQSVVIPPDPAGVDTAVPEKKVMDAPDIPLLDQNTFYDALSAAGDSLVVVDFYTDWCAFALFLMCGPFNVIVVGHWDTHARPSLIAPPRPQVRTVQAHLSNSVQFPTGAHLRAAVFFCCQ